MGYSEIRCLIPNFVKSAMSRVDGIAVVAEFDATVRASCPPRPPSVSRPSLWTVERIPDMALQVKDSVGRQGLWDLTMYNSVYLIFLHKGYFSLGIGNYVFRHHLQ